ncbi:SurA N-terminal domain-containing protein [Rhodobacter sp. Har01]|uniref:peptidylprolyl isomerase n=1 Tax=Rhodobacter sp. Har01 TaxID=2883999 RepID=UPI001D06F2F4|nr:peptidyl-prolyl cis-trans isomerase [Rhodobacter sp. Har01]MCB6176754.1 SurA N-terminal domain-containing protein [Rhodobacter sp. Har01]
MAKTPDDDAKKPVSRGQKTAAWVLTGLLILGLGGFGVTNFGGTTTSIGSVGDVTLTIDDYARAVQQETAAFSAQVGAQIGIAEALSFGLDRQALQGLVTRAALDDAAGKLGLSVGDQTVAAEVMKIKAFQGTSGFDREAYRQILQREGLTEIEYENSIRAETARTLLQGAVSGGFVAPAAVTDAFYKWVAERRGFAMIRLSEASLATPIPAPTDDELKAHYDTNIAEFTKAEAKRIAYAALLPEMIAKDQPVDEAAVRQLYDERITEFVVPERRLVERLVFPDQATADAAKARAEAGTPFDTLVIERGLTLDAVDLGDVSKADLGAAGEAVFAAAEGSIVAADSDLGPALFRVNGILAGEETSFEAAREGLSEELRMDAARRAISDRIEAIDDLLAGGASLEDLAREMGMEFSTLDHVIGQQGAAPLEGYQAFRNAADAVKQGDFSEAVVLEDGGVVAMEFVETVPAAPIPFDEAKEKVAESWHTAALKAALATQAAAFKAAVEGGADIGSLGLVDRTPEIARDGFVEAAPQSLLPAIFTMAEGEVRVIEEGDFVALVQLEKVMPAATEGDEAKALRAALEAQIQQAISDDAFNAFATAVLAEAGIRLDQAAINAVNARLQ